MSSGSPMTSGQHDGEHMRRRAQLREPPALTAERRLRTVFISTMSAPQASSCFVTDASAPPSIGGLSNSALPRLRAGTIRDRPRRAGRPGRWPPAWRQRNFRPVRGGRPHTLKRRQRAAGVAVLGDDGAAVHPAVQRLERGGGHLPGRLATAMSTSFAAAGRRSLSARRTASSGMAALSAAAMMAPASCRRVLSITAPSRRARCGAARYFSSVVYQRAAPRQAGVCAPRPCCGILTKNGRLGGADRWMID